MHVLSFSSRPWVSLCALVVTLVAAPTAHAQYISPQHPCVDDPVNLIIRAYHSTPCDSFIFGGRVGERQVLIRTLIHEGVYCFAAPFPYPLPIPFGTLPAGPQTINISRHSLVLHTNGTIDSTVADSSISFEVSAVCPPLPTMPADQLPYVDSVLTVPFRPCPESMTTIEMVGHFQNGCGRLVSAANDNGRLSVVLAPSPTPPTVCNEMPARWQAFLPLGFLQTGSHHVEIRFTVLGDYASWPPTSDQSYLGTFDFNVTAPCDTQPELLPYVTSIQVGPDSSAICAGAPIPVSISGSFPNDCYSLRRVEVFDLTMGPMPGVPTVRLTVDDGGCLGRVCLPGPVPWSTTVNLPPLPPGDHGLRVELAQVSCSDSFPPGNLYATSVPFRVGSDSCGTVPTACVAGHWQGGSDCNAFVSTTHPTAQLIFEVLSGTALSGLQGTLKFRELGLMIYDLQPIGPAAGMHLSWIRVDNGVRFVMFADQGAPIPGIAGSTSPVINVTVGPMPVPVPMEDNTGGGIDVFPSAFHLSAEQLLGADIDAQPVPDCVSLGFDSNTTRLAIPTATICLEVGCDFNRDGAADVRDLVLMVRCVNGTGPCPFNPVEHFDCDGNQEFALHDVFCCARNILSGPGCPGCPVDSVRASSGEVMLVDAVVTATGADVTLRVTQPHELGAAVLGIRFPADRYGLAAVELHDPDWIALQQWTTTGASLGLIRLQPTIRLDLSPLEVVLHLQLLPGQTAAGEVRLESGDFSANDGVKLGVAVGEDGRALGGALQLSVSQARPNPFTGETRFTVSLDGNARLEVGIYDIGGRRIARLFRGTKGPGLHVFAWDGRREDGTGAGEGIYFYRVASPGRTVTGKVALLRAR